MPNQRPDLDELLHAWGGQQRLTDVEAETIRSTIVTQPTSLPATWWSDFTAQMTATVVQATTRPAPPLITGGLTATAAA